MQDFSKVHTTENNVSRIKTKIQSVLVSAGAVTETVSAI